MATREYLTNATVTMTDRGSEFLARKHGFVDLAHLQDWLPLEAHVLDIGAGYSPFGADVARERPDIQWTNVDINYDDYFFAHNQSIFESAPNNLTFEQGDATKLTRLYGRRAVDCVFSYWLFLHFDKLDPAIGRLAARECLDVTKEGGLVSVGPRVGLRSRPSAHQVAINKSVEADSDHLAGEIVAATSPRAYINRKLQPLRDLSAHPSLFRGIDHMFPVRRA